MCSLTLFAAARFESSFLKHEECSTLVVDGEGVAQGDRVSRPPRRVGGGRRRFRSGEVSGGSPAMYLAAC